MNVGYMIRGHIKKTIGTVLYWILAFWAFDMFRFVGLSDLPGITLEHEVSFIKSLEL